MPTLEKELTSELEPKRTEGKADPSQTRRPMKSSGNQWTVGPQVEPGGKSRGTRLRSITRSTTKTLVAVVEMPGAEGKEGDCYGQ